MSPDKLAELPGLEAELLRLSGSLEAQQAARSRAQGKGGEWEAKERKLRGAGEAERVDWARGDVEKAVKKAKEQRANVEQLQRAVARLEDWVGRGRKVKEEVEDVVQDRVKEVVEEVVVKVEGPGMAWFRGFFFGKPGAGGHHGYAWGPRRPQGPPRLETPLLLPSVSPVWTFRFVMHRVHHKIFGPGEVGVGG